MLNEIARKRERGNLGQFSFVRKVTRYRNGIEAEIEIIEVELEEGEIKKKGGGQSYRCRILEELKF